MSTIAGVIAWLRTLNGPQDPKRLADEIEATSWPIDTTLSVARDGRVICPDGPRCLNLDCRRNHEHSS